MTATHLTIRLDSPQATAACACALEPFLGARDAVLLSGPVGAGKSHFARHLIDARLRRLGRPEDIPSPTFTLVQTYDGGSCNIWHCDLYRLNDHSELHELGLFDAFEQDICIVEWPDRLAGDGPRDALQITLHPGQDANRRDLTLIAPPRWQGAVSAIAEAAARASQTERFLDKAGWAAADREALPGDASTRRYQRLYRGDDSAMLMDAPPESCGPLTPFLRMTDWLLSCGYSAPRIMAQDTAQGLLLLEDLGSQVLAQVLSEHPEAEPAAYQALTAFLIDLHRQTPPRGLELLDSARMGEMVRLAADWYGAAAKGALPGDGTDAGAALDAAVRRAHERLCDGPVAVALRDFHAENIIPLPDRDGHRQLGLLDYQDAVLAHPAYDLVSALQDARRDVPPDIETAELRRYARLTGADQAAFTAAYALIGTQRNLRILGVFTRLGLTRGKPHYLALIPRVWGYIQRNLTHPTLQDLRATVAHCLPEPTPERLKRIADQCPRNPTR